MTKTLIKLHEGVHLYDARDLVHSELFEPGDWGFGDEDGTFYNTCDCNAVWDEKPEIYWHVCQPELTNAEKCLQVFKWKSVSPMFRNSIGSNGIVNPIHIEIVGNHNVLRNGHHRLMVAYQRSLVLPVWYGVWDYTSTPDDYRPDLPWSGDHDY